MQYNIALGIVFSLLFISLVVVFCAVLIKLYIKKIKEHNKIELEFQKTLNTTILEAQEQLLTTISRDLHDDAGQQLTVINFQLENLKIDFPSCEVKLSPISVSVNRLSDSLRKISHTLNSNWLLENGLIKAISEELTRIDNQNTIKTSLKIIDKTKKKKESNNEIIVFRIFQEIINNILKHAKASKIDVTIKTSPLIKITVTDNGIGFDVAQKNDSLGIKNCNERAKIINYQFTIKSEINCGTTIILEEKKP